jgi:hypothetical protein
VVRPERIVAARLDTYRPSPCPPARRRCNDHRLHLTLTHQLFERLGHHAGEVMFFEIVPIRRGYGAAPAAGARTGEVRDKSLPFNNRERASDFRSAGAQLLVGLRGATVPVSS